MARAPAFQPHTRRAPLLGALAFVGRLLLAFVKLALLAIELAVLAGLCVYYYYGRELEGLEAGIGRHRPAETTQIYARDGQTLLFELVDPQGGRRTVVDLQRMPKALRDATIAVEDANFYENPGVDLRGIVRAMLQNYQSQEVVSGASTITQQLVRNVLLPPEQRSAVSFERKLREAILAFKVSRKYSKDQILGMYLNEVYYGNQAYGVEAAAQTYFGKHVWELNVAEATLIAGLPQSPTVLNPLTNLAGAKARQKITLGLMVKFGYITTAEARAAFGAPLNFVPQQTSLVAPHFVFYVRQLLEQRYGPDVLYRGGLRVVTSLDLHWQAEAEHVVRERLAELRARNASNAGVVMLSPEGQVLAMVGSADYNDQAIDGEVNVALAPRQPGSALKPIVYAAAMRRGWTPATVLWDEPTEFKLSDGTVYAPHNYDDSWHGPQRLRMALANSLNIPAVKAMEFVGVENFVEQAHAMGITTLNDTSAYGLALVLGAGEVRLLDLTNVYNTIRNGGYKRDPVPILKVTNSRGEVLENISEAPGRQALGEHGEQIAYLLTDILSDNLAREYMFGPGNVMELPDGRPAAVKTGTSNDWRDSWAVGFTRDVTVGVWVGNSDGAPMQEVAGVNGAGTIWREIMDRYHAGRPILAFPSPSGISTAAICADTGALAADACPSRIEEHFVAGTEPKTSDVFFKTVKVAGDGSCLAAPYSPPAEVREQRFPVYPAQFQQWAADHGVPQVPSKYCPPPQSKPEASIALIGQPAAGATITTTQVLVRGTARGGYTLDWSSAARPDAWQPLAEGAFGVTDGILGVWRTAELPPGDYLLRLRIITPDGVTVEARNAVKIVR
ncbi:MAG TPA: PBP1A family penicillin-binding protein [Kouleothrix sp.]|uniref:transglycosylase domain-containing protein n=1 Tax=Kouleothrix sp. TaxID=2779161 RepID=UPI002CE870BC|nr:PBP1A family penicillin-binding protein [Kouleothrix sp.]HRC74270.1 PBP1A family penicillin-binding protein [Kouleothrix sp.]